MTLGDPIVPTQNTGITKVDRSKPLLHQHGYEIQPSLRFSRNDWNWLTEPMIFRVHNTRYAA
ncbi:MULTISPECIES: hypothetical protein [Nostoc]|jgi:hypothetical protein|uniref:Uncharacterized protein n=1 Tax=Nostoc flagelliforme FACHB-838 TaxID=2692904 RepID=A0ABR8E1A5_9NOSO|nr:MULTISPECIES: hypothetical protein [Nostoc]MBD2248339.1 hypothetical protein [Nostoc sp. FACHB-888]MBD2534344.1 hypothetical protein [Nostoc flagelliforme FACHB-838]